MNNENPYATPTANLLNPSADSDTLAGRWTRFAASLIDGIVMLIVFIPLRYFFGTSARVAEASQLDDVWMRETANLGENLLFGFLASCFWIVVNFSFLPNGQTIGKRILKIKVVRKNGTPLERKRYILIRYVPMTAASMIPIVGGILGLVNALLIFRSERNMFHDDIADTKVVKA